MLIYQWCGQETAPSVSMRAIFRTNEVHISIIKLTLLYTGMTTDRET